MKNNNIVFLPGMPDIKDKKQDRNPEVERSVPPALKLRRTGATEVQ
jgi:hypothetical protein